MLTFCECFGLPFKSHSEIEFVNVIPNTDLKVFLDPTLISFCSNSWAQEANYIMNNYFDFLYQAHKETQYALSRRLYLMQHCHERNETRLGYGNGANGKAKTPDGIIRSLNQLTNLFSCGMDLKKASELPVFIRDFAEDCMSDVLTNLLSSQIQKFTIRIAEKYHLPIHTLNQYGYYWNPESGRWQRYQYRTIIMPDSGRPIYLVPKNIVRQCYYVNAEQYLRSVVLTRMQQELTSYTLDGKAQKPNKDELKKWSVGKYGSVIDSNIQETIKYPNLLIRHREIVDRKSNKLFMTDDQLDNLVNIAKFKIA